MSITRKSLATYFCDTLAEEENKPQIALASERFRAIDLSCRACGAMAMGAGLGFPVGVSAPLRFHPQPPIFYNNCRFRSLTLIVTYKTKLKLDKEVGGGVSLHWKSVASWLPLVFCVVESLTTRMRQTMSCRHSAE